MKRTTGSIWENLNVLILLCFYITDDKEFPDELEVWYMNYSYYSLKNVNSVIKSLAQNRLEVELYSCYLYLTFHFYRALKILL